MNTHVRLTTSAAEAASALRAGNLAALPTETVYGLGADAENPSAVAKIFQVKGRPADHPVIVHIADRTALDAWATDIPEFARALAEACWPGPMTLVLPRSARATDQVTGGQPSIALRVSGHPDFRAVLSLFCEATHPAAGIAAPSANRFGRVSPTTAAHVLDELADITGEDDVVFDGGPSEIGVESTIIDCTGSCPVILRAGAITAQQVQDITHLPVGSTSAVRASGTLDVHYAPNAEVLAVSAEDMSDIPAGSGFIAMASLPTPPQCVRLLAAESADAYAHDLYSALRAADAQGLAKVYVVPPPASGIGIAINDRITRAAAARVLGTHDA